MITDETSDLTSVVFTSNNSVANYLQYTWNKTSTVVTVLFERTSWKCVQSVKWLLLSGITCRIMLIGTSDSDVSGLFVVISANYTDKFCTFCPNWLIRILCKLHYWTSSSKRSPAQIMFKALIQTGLALHWEPG